MDEIPDQIGERLRKARQDAGLEVDDVVFKTRLPRSAVEALEAEDFSHFISPVYAKSFLAQYSTYLNVEAAPWLDALKPSAYIEGDPLLSLLGTAGPPQVESKSGHESHGGWLSALWLLVLSCGVVLGAVKAFEVFEKRFGVEITPQTHEPVTGNQAAPRKTPAAEVSPLPSEKPDPPKKEEDPFRPPPRAIIVR